jgi:serine/threonine protein kinase
MAEICPPVVDFEAMVRGRLDEEASDRLIGHVEHCVSCQQLLERLTAAPNLTAALRKSVADPASSIPPLNDLVARLEDMASQFTPMGDLHPSSIAGDDVKGSETFVPPDRAGQHRVLRMLGAGGMGIVYLAEDPLLHRQVAVKMLRPRLARQVKAREGFLREARAMAALKHDNVVTVFQVGETDGPDGQPVPFLAMELLEGESLADWLRREGALKPEWVARIGRQAAEGLSAAHVRKVIHRDIKPGNLWLETPPGWSGEPPLPVAARVKVLDFGLAQPIGDEGTEGGRVLGTPAYMSPEQSRGEVLDPRADLFSLGVVLYELLAGQLPFVREPKVAKIEYPSPIPIGELAHDTPPILANLVMRMLDPNPAKRPSSAQEVARVLATIPGSNELHDTLGATKDPTTTVIVQQVAPQRQWVNWVVGSLAVIAIVSVVGLTFFNRPEPTSPTELPPPPGAPDDNWLAAVAKLPLTQQPNAVALKLKELNPRFDGRIAKLGFDDDKVRTFGIITDGISDIRPIRAFPHLRQLDVTGSSVGKGMLTDLSPIKGLPLDALNIWENPNLSDISAVRGMKLALFQAGDTAIEDFSPLEGMPVSVLALNSCKVHDLKPIQTMPKLRHLRCDGCPISTLSPLLQSTVKELTFTYKSDRGDLEILKKMPQLDWINRRSPSDFFKLLP